MAARRALPTNRPAWTVNLQPGTGQERCHRVSWGTMVWTTNDNLIACNPANGGGGLADFQARMQHLWNALNGTLTPLGPNEQAAVQGAWNGQPSRWYSLCYNCLPNLRLGFASTNRSIGQGLDFEDGSFDLNTLNGRDVFVPAAARPAVAYILRELYAAQGSNPNQDAFWFWTGKYRDANGNLVDIVQTSDRLLTTGTMAATHRQVVFQDEHNNWVVLNMQNYGQ
eukprot:UN04713